MRSCAGPGVRVVALSAAIVGGWVVTGVPSSAITQSARPAAQGRGSITIIKDAVPDDAQDFNFKTKGDGVRGFTLDDDKDPEHSNTKTFRRLKSGKYKVTEKRTSGWWLIELTCDTGERIDLARRRVRIRLSGDEHVTCTFTNVPLTGGGGRRPRPAARGAITIVKDAVPDGPQAFRFSSTAPSYQQFFLDEDPKTVRPNSITIAGLRADTYQFIEEVPADWELARRSCVVFGVNGSTWKRRGSASIRIKLKAGDHVVCVFRNEQFGTMQVAKVAAPSDGAPSFPFEFQARGATIPFAVTPGVIANKFTYPPGKYAFTEGEVAGWKLADIQCNTPEQPDVGRRRVDIKLLAGETIVCTFTNTKGRVGDQEEPGTLTVVKNAIPNDGQDFFFTITPDVAITPFRLDDDNDATFPTGQTFSMTPGTYTITEMATDGWDTKVSCSDGTSAPGRVIQARVKANQDLVCTYTNTKKGDFGAVLTIFKNAQPNDPQDFLFTITPRIALTPFRLDDDDDPAFYKGRAFDVAPGTYTVSELEATGGWETKVSCSNGASAAGRTIIVTLAADEHVLCEFINTKPDEAGARLTILKEAQPKSDEKFAFTVTPRVAITPFRLIDDGSGSGSAAQGFDVAPGTYTITEAAVEGWDTSIFCTSGETASGRSIEITLELNEDVVCRFTNTKEGEGGGKLTVVKQADPADGQDFGFTITPRVALTLFRLDDDADPAQSSSQTFDVAPGTYTITEAEAAGWDTSVTCDTGQTASGRSVEVTVGADQHITCRFTNTKSGASLTVVKNATPADGQDFLFTVAPDLALTPFRLDVDTDPAQSGSQTFEAEPGTYTITELEASGGWETNISCSSGEKASGRTIAVTLDAGEQVTCTFTNTKGERTSLTVVKQAFPADGQDFLFTVTPDLALTPFRLDDDTDPTQSSSQTFAAEPGTYTITEAEPPVSEPPWATIVQCDSGEEGGLSVVVTLDAGERVTCTFVNTQYGGGKGGPAVGDLVVVSGQGLLLHLPVDEPGQPLGDERFRPARVGGGRLGVSADGTSVYVVRRPVSPDSACDTEIARVSLADGTTEVVVRDATSPAPSPDGMRLAYVALTPIRDGCEAALRVRDLATGEERELSTEEGVAPGGLAWARDGRRLAFDRADGVVVIFDTEATEGPGAGTEIRLRSSAGKGRDWSLVGFVGDDTLLLQAGCTREACSGKTRLVTVDLGDPERAHPVATLPRRVHDVVVDATGGFVLYVRGPSPGGAGRLEWLPLGLGTTRPTVIAKDLVGAALVDATTQPGGP